eukprot:3448761-Rhodomonas_salina.1
MAEGPACGSQLQGVASVAIRTPVPGSAIPSQKVHSWLAGPENASSPGRPLRPHSRILRLPVTDVHG